ncbi:efflux RND transporter permease subunit [Sulfuriflexus mobilis]|uniref:efflux RND transporter permease subunit n=1 Tax=Sulfuriflexus mobilis TaxID=1811807 RepID=UPI000F8497CD|nr:MMPL family transporter [Sulfuriflexus mobilis]
MNNRPPKTDRLAEALANMVIRWRWLVILVTLILVMLIGYGARNLTLSTSYQSFFSPDYPELVAFNAFQKTYSKTDNILFVVQPAEKTVFTPSTAAAIERLTERAWQIPFATRVDSLSNFQNSWANADDLTVEDLYRDGASLSPAQLKEKQHIALSEPLLNGQLISADASTTGINVIMNFPEKSLSELPDAMAVAEQIASEIERDYAGVKVRITGISALNNAFFAVAQSDAMTLMPVMYLLLILVTLIVLRSFFGMLVTVLVIMFSTVAAVGLAGHLGIVLDPISMTAPTVILTLAVADSVHILVTMLGLMREGKDKISSLKESMRINFLPVSVTSITTIIGFLSLNFSASPPFWYLGNITAMGIAAAWLLSLTFLPATIAVLPFKMLLATSKASASSSVPLMTRFANFVTSQYRSILIVSGIAVILLVSMIPRIELNDQWVKYFDEEMEFRQDAEFAMDNLTGLYRLEFSLPAQTPGGVSEPEYLQNVERFTNWLRGLPEVEHVYSYADIIKRLNKNMHGDDQAWYRLPDDRNLAAQYLLLYELSLPYGLDLNDRISVDKSASRVTVTVKELHTAAVRQFLKKTENWLRNNVPEYMWVTPTSPTVMFSYISERNIYGMLSGNAVAVFGIALVLMLSLRSIGLGALSLIPNLIPLLMTFGIWALLVGQVGMGAATVSATSLGIIVDNTVHFLSKYLRARREMAANRPAAIEYAFNTVGWAIAANAAILITGFAWLATSSFRVNMEMGLLTAIAILIALLVNFFLLPALLMIGYQKGAAQYENELATETA